MAQGKVNTSDNDNDDEEEKKKGLDPLHHYDFFFELNIHK